MSLQYAAQHLASKGRGPDTMLVHMAPSEVRGLQAIAMAHGGSLTINPQTGLPEAGFLSSILPMVIGAGLSMIPGVGPMMAAGIVGGGTALATGSLEKGLMAGLGAYGGAGLAGGLTAAGAAGATTGAPASVANTISEGAAAGATATPVPTPSFAVTDLPAQQMINNPSAFVAPPPAAPAPVSMASLSNATSPLGADIASFDPTTAANAAKAAPTNYELAQRGLTGLGTESGRSAFMQSMGGGMGLAKSGLAAAAPMLSQTPYVPGTGDSNARIRDYVFDPISGKYTYIGARKPSEVGDEEMVSRAGGGILRYARGGASPDLDIERAPVAATGASAMPGTITGPSAEQLKSISDLYSSIGRTGDQEGMNYWAGRLAGGESLGDVANAFGASANYVQQQQAQQQAAPAIVSAPAAATGVTAMPFTVTGTTPAVTTPAVTTPATTGIASLQQAAAQPTAEQLQTITNIYQNTLGRDPDAEGLQYWAGRLAQGESAGDVYKALQGSARYVLGSDADKMAPGLSSTLAQATTPYAGFKSSDATSIGDEWVRNVLGREATAADRNMGWYKSLGDLTTTGDTDIAYKNFLNAYGLSGQRGLPSWFEASQLKPVAPRTTPATTGNMPGWTFDPNATVGSGLVRPNEPAGETTGWTPSGTATTAQGAARPVPTMQDIVNAFTRGGGMTGRLPYVPRSLAEQESLYNRMSGESRRAYDYLMGRGEYPRAPANPQIMRPYGEAVLGLPSSTYNLKYIFDPTTQRYIPNPNYKAPSDPGAVAKAKAKAQKVEEEATPKEHASFAQGGISSAMSHLGDYSDGGRLLKGPGDGVSDSIPATIGGKRPARLADGEFVVPARIVSELGNGSTDAGARKLYAMMNRIQNNRRKTVGKKRVAVNSRSDKYLPA